MSSRFSIQNFPAFGMEMTYFSETTEFCTLSAAMIVIPARKSWSFNRRGAGERLSCATRKARCCC
jgi:hypothetical protein